MASAGNEEQHLEERRLKAEVWKAVRQIAHEQIDEEDVDVTPSFLVALTEMVWDRIAESADDLIMFAKHARHAQIQPSDVMLLGRRNEGLESVMASYMETSSQQTEKTQQKRRKTESEPKLRKSS